VAEKGRRRENGEKSAMVVGGNRRPCLSLETAGGLRPALINLVVLRTPDTQCPPNPGNATDPWRKLGASL